MHCVLAHPVHAFRALSPLRTQQLSAATLRSFATAPLLPCLQFNTRGVLVGAAIETYLLEKVRVVTQSEGERNYHVFYQVSGKGTCGGRRCVSLACRVSLGASIASKHSK